MRISALSRNWSSLKKKCFVQAENLQRQKENVEDRLSLAEIENRKLTARCRMSLNFFFFLFPCRGAN
jgi:hypothetical protein